jgi:hypothetical protein
VAFEEAFHCWGLLRVPGIIAVGVTGVLTWAQMDYNLITGGWLPPSPKRAGGITRELEEALADNVPIVLSGVATLLLPVTAYLAVFKSV